MRKASLLFLLVLLAPCAVQAQILPKIEVFGGYSYLRLDTSPSHINLNGWNASVAVKPASWLGFVGDFGGDYGSIAGVSSSLHTFLFGPQISLPAPVSPFVHALFGAARFSAAGSSDTAFASGIGGGFDVRAKKFLGFRLIQADYIATHFGGHTQNDARISAGIVLRF